MVFYRVCFLLILTAYLAIAAEPAPTPADTNTPAQPSATEQSRDVLTNQSSAARIATNRASNNPAAKQASKPVLQAKRGFQVEIAAAAPLIRNPQALAFDENGRAFVAEWPGLAPEQGRITVLEDTDNDGRFDSSSVLAEKLPWVSAVACYDGGVLVATVSDVVFLKEGRQRGTADIRTIVLSGFGSSNRVVNGESLVGSFQWGPDSRIHATTAGIGGMVSSSAQGSEPVQIGGFDFSFDPRTYKVFLETGPAQSGLAFDDHGRKFVSDFDRPLRMPAIPARYLLRNRYLPAPLPFVDVARPGLPLFPASVATPEGRPLVAGGTNTAGLREPARPAAAWITEARGTTIYRGNVFPTNFYGNAFVSDPAARVVHRLAIRGNGLYPLALRPTDDASTEFLSSADPAFRPVQAVNCPEGVLFVVDRGTSENGGHLYRIAPDSHNPQPAQKLGSASTMELAAALVNRNGWHRDTAARLLYQRQDPAAIPLLSNMLNNARSPLARLQALRVMSGQNALTPAQLLRSARDTDESVRRLSLKLLEPFAVDRRLPESALPQLRALAQDPSLIVRYELALLVGSIATPGKPALYLEMLNRDLGVPGFTNAVLSSVGDECGLLASMLARNPAARNSAPAQAIAIELARMAGASGQLPVVTPILDLLASGNIDPAFGYAILQNLGEGLVRAGSSVGLMDPSARLQSVFAQALDTAIDGSAAPALRARAAAALSVSPYQFAEIGDWLLALVSPSEPLPVQLGALQALGHFNEPRVYTDLLQRWPKLAPMVRVQAAIALLSRSERAPAVAMALETGKISPGDIPAPWLNYLRTHPDASVGGRVRRFLGNPVVARPAVLQAMQPALKLTGSPMTGRDIYNGRCAACHRLAPDGTLPPDMAAAKAGGKERLLVDIVEPDRRIAPRDIPFILESKTGEVRIGVLQGSNDVAITFRDASGSLGSPDPAATDVVVWPWQNIAFIDGRSWSLMPAGLEQGLSTQQMADLLSFILSR